MRIAKTFLRFALVVSASLVWFPLGPTATDSMQGAMFGDPLPGLSSDDRLLFEAGKEDFNEVQEVKDGLGPLFNARGCGECHSFPTTGGAVR